jgi:hypothetical protein
VVLIAIGRPKHRGAVQFDEDQANRLNLEVGSP